MPTLREQVVDGLKEIRKVCVEYKTCCCDCPQDHACWVFIGKFNHSPNKWTNKMVAVVTDLILAPLTALGIEVD